MPVNVNTTDDGHLSGGLPSRLGNSSMMSVQYPQLRGRFKAPMRTLVGRYGCPDVKERWTNLLRKEGK
jgi:hypothetical protein